MQSIGKVSPVATQLGNELDMNFYDQIKGLLISNEIYKRVMDYSKNKSDVKHIIMLKSKLLKFKVEKKELNMAMA